MVQEIPVYMFMGFLESGKTTFAKETLLDRDFTEGEPTLLLVCEEGIEEYDEDDLKSKNIFLEYIEEENLDKLKELEKYADDENVLNRFIKSLQKQVDFCDNFCYNDILYGHCLY